jgi:hypothetical protein
MSVEISFIDEFSCLSIGAIQRARHLSILTSKVCDWVFAANGNNFLDQATDRTFADTTELAAWLSTPGSRVRLKSGVFDGRAFVLNAAMGNQSLRVMARIEGGCDIGTFVARKDRAWFAGLVRRAMSENLLEADGGLRNLPILAETGTEVDLVIASPSSGLSFPSSPADIDALRDKGIRGLSPEDWIDFRLPPLQ